MKRKNITFTMDPSIVDMFKKYCDHNAYLPSRKLELMILDLLKQESTEKEEYVDSLLKTKKYLFKQFARPKFIILMFRQNQFVFCGPIKTDNGNPLFRNYRRMIGFQN